MGVQVVSKARALMGERAVLQHARSIVSSNSDPNIWLNCTCAAVLGLV